MGTLAQPNQKTSKNNCGKHPPSHKTSKLKPAASFELMSWVWKKCSGDSPYILLPSSDQKKQVKITPLHYTNRFVTLRLNLMITLCCWNHKHYELWRGEIQIGMEPNHMFGHDGSEGYRVTWVYEAYGKFHPLLLVGLLASPLVWDNASRNQCCRLGW